MTKTDPKKQLEAALDDACRIGFRCAVSQMQQRLDRLTLVGRTITLEDCVRYSDLDSSQKSVIVDHDGSIEKQGPIKVIDLDKKPGKKSKRLGHGVAKYRILNALRYNPGGVRRRELTKLAHEAGILKTSTIPGTVTRAKNDKLIQSNGDKLYLTTKGSAYLNQGKKLSTKR